MLDDAARAPVTFVELHILEDIGENSGEVVDLALEEVLEPIYG